MFLQISLYFCIRIFQKLKNVALTVVIIIGYLIGIELMGFLFRGNRF